MDSPLGTLCAELFHRGDHLVIEVLAKPGPPGKSRGKAWINGRKDAVEETWEGMALGSSKVLNQSSLSHPKLSMSVETFPPVSADTGHHQDVHELVPACAIHARSGNLQNTRQRPYSGQAFLRSLNRVALSSALDISI
jgi:hypothetical protein